MNEFQIRSKLQKRFNNVINSLEFNRLKDTLMKFKPIENVTVTKPRNAYSTKTLAPVSKQFKIEKKYERTRKRTKTFQTKELVINNEDEVIKSGLFSEEYTAIKVGDSVELIKNFIFPPKLDLKGLTHDNYYAMTTITNSNKETLTDRDIYNQYMESHRTTKYKTNKIPVLKNNKIIKLSSLLPDMQFNKGRNKKTDVLNRDINDIGGSVKYKDSNIVKSGLNTKYYPEIKPLVLRKLRSTNVLEKVFKN